MKDNNDPVQVNIQIPLHVREDFKIAARTKGMSMSSMIHQYIIRTIHEEKVKFPTMFPDYTPPPVIVSDERTMDDLIDAATHEIAGNVSDATLQMIRRMVKAATEIPEQVVHKRSNVVATIQPGEQIDREQTHDEVQRTFDREIEPRKRKKA